MSDFEAVPGIADVVVRKLDNGELIFKLESAAQILRGCTRAGIAVLGVEVFPGLNLSTYDLFLKDPANEANWPGYVHCNNILAEDFIMRDRAPGGSQCVLSTVSWREFLNLQQQALF